MMATINLTQRAPSDPIPFRIRERLDGDDYRIDFRFNQRANTEKGAWFINISTSDGTLLLASQKLVLANDLFPQFKYINGFPQGKFRVVESGSTDVEAGLFDLNNRISLLYDEVENG